MNEYKYSPRGNTFGVDAWPGSGLGGSLAHIPIVAEARRIPVLVLQHLPRLDNEARGLLHHTLYPVPDIA
jgi:hypothetical protein